VFNIFSCRHIGSATICKIAIKNKMGLVSLPADKIQHGIGMLIVFHSDLFVTYPN